MSRILEPYLTGLLRAIVTTLSQLFNLDNSPYPCIINENQSTIIQNAIFGAITALLAAPVPIPGIEDNPNSPYNIFLPEMSLV